VKEAAWAVSNITAGTPNQIQLVINAQVLQPLIEVLSKVIQQFLNIESGGY
jgi:importin subunit alpha-1